MQMKRSIILAASQLLSGIWQSILTADKERTEKKEKPPKDLKTRYFLSKNLRLMEGELNDIKKSGYDAYEAQRIAKIKEYAVKDDKGEIIVGENGTMTLERVGELNLEINKLQTEHEELFKHLDEEVNFEPFSILLSDLTIDIPLGPQDLAILENFIKE